MRKRLLIIEDNPIAKHCYQLLLNDHPNIQPFFADRGDEALMLIDNLARPIDLIFLDKGLPDMDGCILAQRLRDQGVKCPIIVVSTTKITPLVQGHYHPLIQRFYPKPLRPDQLEQIIERYL